MCHCGWHGIRFVFGQKGTTWFAAGLSFCHVVWRTKQPSCASFSPRGLNPLQGEEKQLRAEYPRIQGCASLREPVFWGFLGTFPKTYWMYCFLIWYIFQSFCETFRHLLDEVTQSWVQTFMVPDNESHRRSPTQTIPRTKRWHRFYAKHGSSNLYVHMAALVHSTRRISFTRMVIKSFSVSMSRDLEVSYIISWKYRGFFFLHSNTRWWYFNRYIYILVS